MSKKKKRKSPRFLSRSTPKLIVNIAGRAQWKTYVLESEKPVVVDFWAPWCAPCRAMGPILEEAAANYKDSVRFAKVNTQSNPQIARDFNIRSIPTLIIFNRGEVFDVNVGLTNSVRLEKMVGRALNKHQGKGWMERFKRLWRKNDKEGVVTESKAEKS